jgi:hypothetical protein
MSRRLNVGSCCMLHYSIIFFTASHIPTEPRGTNTIRDYDALGGIEYCCRPLSLIVILSDGWSQLPYVSHAHKARIFSESSITNYRFVLRRTGRIP